VRRQAKDGNCLQVEYYSAALASVWPDVDPQGMIQVELHAVDASGAYDARHVAYGWVSLGC
jgi:hypothetical protein